MDINWSVLDRVLISWKYLLFLLFALTGWIFLSRNRGFDRIRILTQLLSLLLFGGVIGLVVPWVARNFGLHPSPMCAVTKGTAFAALRSVLPIPMVTLVFVSILFTIVGAKAFCGWACPLGALQELVNKIPGPWKIRLPFRWTNGIRVLALLAFVPLLMGLKVIIFDYFNPFELFHWRGLANVFVLGPPILVVTASYFVYRPFCSVLCPLGVLTWVFESVSLGRIRVGSDCTSCGICLDNVQCQALPALVERSRVIPDCHGCGACQDQCPEEVISYSWRARWVERLGAGLRSVLSWRAVRGTS
jgi:polyferredoxin